MFNIDYKLDNIENFLSSCFENFVKPDTTSPKSKRTLDQFNSSIDIGGN